MKLYVVRHGETIENEKGIVQGQIDGTLTNKGVQQAKDTAEKLKDIDVDKIYTSDLGRARLTAEEIAKYHKDTPFVEDVRLREINFGEAQGKFGKDPKLSPGWEAFKKDFWHNRVQGGESNGEVRLRTQEFLNEIYTKHPDGNFLLVTHGGPMRHIKNLANPDLDMEQLFKEYIENGVVWEFDINETLESGIP